MSKVASRTRGKVQPVFLFFLGALFVGLALWSFYQERTVAGGATFACGFALFAWASLYRFKRFKGYGFEAEMWEEKQEEAAELIERLRSLYALHTREILYAKAFTSGGEWGWSEVWALYDELLAGHKRIANDAGLVEERAWLESYFIFDMCFPITSRIQVAIAQARSKAINLHEQIMAEDPAAEAHRVGVIESVVIEPKHEFLGLAARGKLAGAALELADSASRALQSKYSIELEIDATDIHNLKLIDEACQQRPLRVTPELIKLADVGMKSKERKPYLAWRPRQSKLQKTRN